MTVIPFTTQQPPRNKKNTSATPPPPCTRLKNALELRNTTNDISLQSRLQIIVGQLILKTRPQHNSPLIVVVVTRLITCDGNESQDDDYEQTNGDCVELHFDVFSKKAAIVSNFEFRH